MKKALYLLVLIYLFAGIFVYSAGQSETTEGALAEKITLHWWWGIPVDKGPQQTMDAYMKLHPNINMVYTKLGWDAAADAKMTTALMGGEGVDVYSAPRAPLQKAAQGLALDLTPFLQRDNIDLVKDLGKDAEGYLLDGKYYGIPMNRSINFFFLNMDAFEDSGVELPGEDWTILDYKEIAKKLTKGTGPAKRYGAFITANWELFWKAITFSYIEPADYFNEDATETRFTDPLMVEALQLYMDMSLKDKSIPTLAELIAEKYYPNTVYMSEKAAMALVSTYTFRDLKDREKYPHSFKTAFVSCPLHHKDKKQTKLASMHDVHQINPKSDYIEEGWEFTAWLLRDGFEYLIEFGRLPAYKGFTADYVSECFTKGYEDILDLDSFYAMYNNDRPISRRLFGPQITESTHIYIQESEKALSGQISAEEAAKRAKERADQVLTDWNKEH